MSESWTDAERDQFAHSMWMELIKVIDHLVERADAGGQWSTQAGTALAGDDRATSPYQTSHAFGLLLNAGIDNLNAVRHLIFGRPSESPTQPVLHQAAHYVLARGAMENFATAYWILGPRQRDERVRRTFRWYMQNVSDQQSALGEFPAANGPRSSEEKLERLQQLVEARTGERLSKNQQSYSISKVVQYVRSQEQEPERMLNVETMWRLCSGFAHARPWATLGYLEREELSTADDDVLIVRLTSDFTRTVIVAQKAIEICDLLLKRHDFLNTRHFYER